MRIVYDNIVYSLQRCGGISVVWTNLLSRIQRKENDIHYIECDGAVENNISRKQLQLDASKVTLLPSKWLKLFRYLNPRVTSKQTSGKYIFHSSYYRTVKDKNAINVTTVHDFAYEYYVKNPLVRYVHSFQKNRAIRNSDHVVCISENTRRDLLQLLPDVDPNKVSVIYNGIDNKFFWKESFDFKDYVLYVGNRDRYKNFLAAVKPLAECGVKLKIAGKPLLEHEVELMQKCGLDYEYCGMVSDEELNNLYNEALCLVYPSAYEGFGLPVLEAQMAGCPVLAYNASSIPEVIGDRSLLIDEISRDAIEQKLTLFRNMKERERIVKDGLANCKRFSWDKMAAEYHSLYRQLLK